MCSEILSRTPLLGIVPESKEVLRASNMGSPVILSDPKSAPTQRAYSDAARRLKGEQILIYVPKEAKESSQHAFCTEKQHEPNRIISPGLGACCPRAATNPLAHERANRGNNLTCLASCAKRVLAVIGRHVSYGPEKSADQAMDRGKSVSTLAVDIQKFQMDLREAQCYPRGMFTRSSVVDSSQITAGAITSRHRQLAPRKTSARFGGARSLRSNR